MSDISFFTGKALRLSTNFSLLGQAADCIISSGKTVSIQYHFLSLTIMTTILDAIVATEEGSKTYNKLGHKRLKIIIKRD